VVKGEEEEDHPLMQEMKSLIFAQTSKTLVYPSPVRWLQQLVLHTMSRGVNKHFLAL